MARRFNRIVTSKPDRVTVAKYSGSRVGKWTLDVSEKVPQRQ
jgi:hypothetical protein